MSEPLQGQRRLEAMRDVLGSLLRRGGFRSARTAERDAREERPSVETLLAVDAHYRPLAGLRVVRGREQECAR
jgi:hypothetical protein